MRVLPSVFALTMILASCSPDEPFISSFDNSWRLVGTVSGPVSVTTMPSGSMVTSSLTPTGKSTNSVIRVFRDNIYVCSDSNATIEIANRLSLTSSGSIVLDTLGPAHDITFANATTAYATHPATNIVSVIDITVNKVVRTIAVGLQPRGITCLGNQIAVACAGDNTVHIIDSRTNSSVQTIAVGDVPWFVDAEAESRTFIVASKGHGKVDSLPKTAPTLSSINIDTKALYGTVELKPRTGVLVDQDVRGLAVVPEGYAYVPLNGSLVRVSVKLKGSVATSLIEDISSVSYNAARSEIVVAHGSPDDNSAITVDVYDTFFETKRTSTSVSSAYRYIVGIPQ